MAKSTGELIDEIKLRMGRSDDSAVITDARVLGLLNEAQEDIAETISCIQNLRFRNTASYDLSHDTARYSLADLTNPLVDATAGAAHLYDVWMLDGNESVRLRFLPVDEFDAAYPDLTSSDYPTGEPRYWTRRGDSETGYIEIAPMCSSDYDGNALRVDGQMYPKELTADVTTVSPQVKQMEQGLIFYALKEAWGLVGGDTGDRETLKYEAKYGQWSEDYANRSGRLGEWESNFYGVEEG